MILEPFFIAADIKLLPSMLLPFIAKKISFFFTFELSKEIPEKETFLTIGVFLEKVKRSF